MPKKDIIETDREIEITVEMPGLERKDVDISQPDGSKLLVLRASARSRIPAAVALPR